MTHFFDHPLYGVPIVGGLMNCGSVARVFETSRRHEVLSFKHHAEVAALPPAEANELFDLAEAEN